MRWKDFELSKGSAHPKKGGVAPKTKAAVAAVAPAVEATQCSQSQERNLLQQQEEEVKTGWMFPSYYHNDGSNNMRLRHLEIRAIQNENMEEFEVSPRRCRLNTEETARVSNHLPTRARVDSSDYPSDELSNNDQDDDDLHDHDGGGSTISSLSGDLTYLSGGRRRGKRSPQAVSKSQMKAFVPPFEVQIIANQDDNQGTEVVVAERYLRRKFSPPSSSSFALKTFKHTRPPRPMMKTATTGSKKTLDPVLSSANSFGSTSSYQSSSSIYSTGNHETNEGSLGPTPAILGQRKRRQRQLSHGGSSKRITVGSIVGQSSLKTQATCSSTVTITNYSCAESAETPSLASSSTKKSIGNTSSSSRVSYSKAIRNEWKYMMGSLTKPIKKIPMLKPKKPNLQRSTGLLT